MPLKSSTVAFTPIGYAGGYTDDYKNIWLARINDPAGFRRMCESLITQPASCDNSRAVYALAGLRLLDLDRTTFDPFMDMVAKRDGDFTWGPGGCSVETRPMWFVREIFTGRFKSSQDFKTPPGIDRPRSMAIPDPVVVPPGPPPPPPINSNVRQPDPPHRKPTCNKCSRLMEMHLLHVDAFCDAPSCRMPLPATAPAWSCVRCDQDICHTCALKMFAPQVLAGGAGVGVPLPAPSFRPPTNFVGPGDLQLQTHQHAARREGLPLRSSHAAPVDVDRAIVAEKGGVPRRGSPDDSVAAA